MKLKAEKRKIVGKKVKALRREGLIPAILFGGNKEPQPLQLDQTKFERVYQEAGESTIVDLDLGGEKTAVLIADVQRDPFGRPLHADLQRIEAGEKLTATVTIETEGESPAVKDGKGILLTLLDEVEIECLPQDLPSEIKVDISSLTEVGQGIEVKDLPIDHTKVKVLGHEPEEMVLKIDYAEMEEEKEEKPTEEEAIAAVEAKKEKPTTEAGSHREQEKEKGAGKGKEQKTTPEEKPKDEEKKS